MNAPALPLCACGCGERVRNKRCRYLFTHHARLQPTGSQAYRWQGGETRNGGYVLIYKPDHPGADAQGYVRRARLVLEQTLGRLLTETEIVHHLNRKRDDDRPENLEVLPSQSVHAGRHNRQREAGSGSRPPRQYCRHGHEYTPENTGVVVWNGQRGRRCRACHRNRMREWQRRRDQPGYSPQRAFHPAPHTVRRECCKHGHPFTPDNTRLAKNHGGGLRRVCIECNRIKAREYARRKRALKPGRPRKSAPSAGSDRRAPA
jgi:hypothetical protein